MKYKTNNRKSHSFSQTAAKLMASMTLVDCGILINISEGIVSQRKGILSQSVDTMSKPLPL